MSTHGVTPRGEARRLQEGVERMPDLDRAVAGEGREGRSGRRRSHPSSVVVTAPHRSPTKKLFDQEISSLHHLQWKST